MRPIGSKLIAFSAGFVLVLAGCGSSASTPTASALTTAPPVASPSPAAAAVAASASAASSVPSVEPSAAVVGAQPDGMIRLGPSGYAGAPTSVDHGPWLGNGIVNATGASQTAIWLNAGSAMVAGTFYTYDISIRNVGSGPDRFGVKVTGAATNAWVLSYRHGVTNIPATLVAGTFRTPSLAPGATYLFSARITNEQGGGLSDHLVSITSAADPAKVDVVRFAFRWN